MFRCRLATLDDIPALQCLIEHSVRSLSQGHYTCQQIESALRYVFGPDTQLILDRTYFLIENGQRELIAAGGWSRRHTLYGGDQMKSGKDSVLDPTTDAARIRAFFVHPDWSRRGLGRLLFDRCANGAITAGFCKMELMATLPGELLYRALGFAENERIMARLPDGAILPLVHMTRGL